MVTKSGGGAATNSGIDFQQRVASFFVLSMGLELDVANVLGQAGNVKVKSVSFETDDCIDDIVLYHESYKTYLQAKRKLSLSEQENSDFYKTVEQFVFEYHNSLNVNDCYVIATSMESSKKILSDFKNICESARLNAEGIEQNPMSSSEIDAYNKFKNCVDTITEKNKLNVFSKEDLNIILKRIYVVSLAVESGGVYESAFLTSIACSLTTEPRLIWSLIITKTLDWSKKRQSIDLAAIKLLLSEFITTKSFKAEDDDELISFKFDPEKYDICSGREIVIIDSFFPDSDIALLELYRFDDDGNRRIKFGDTYVEMGNGSKYKLYARFATFSGAERYISEQKWMQSKQVVIGPINGENNYDASPIAVAYSDKIRKKFFLMKISHHAFTVVMASLLKHY